MLADSVSCGNFCEVKNYKKNMYYSTIIDETSDGVIKE